MMNMLERIFAIGLTKRHGDGLSAATDAAPLEVDVPSGATYAVVQPIDGDLVFEVGEHPDNPTPGSERIFGYRDAWISLLDRDAKRIKFSPIAGATIDGTVQFHLVWKYAAL